MPPKRNGDKDLPVKPFRSQETWQRWLDAHHERSLGVWIQFARKDSGIATVTHGQALDVALCYGWIDGQVKPLDDRYFLQRFTPRTARSKWSKVNRDHVARLTDAGRMRPAGIRQVEAAKADGRWDAAYDSPRTAAVPEDLRAALNKDPRAAAFFDTLKGRNRYAILYRLQSAKRPETRARRIEAFVAMLSNGETIYP